MDFVPVPPGTAADAALGHRGGDPDCLIATDHGYLSCAAQFAYPSNAPGAAGFRLTPYSTTVGALGGGFFASDPAVLQSVIANNAVVLDAVGDLWDQLVVDGLDADRVYTSPAELAAEVDRVVTGLDLSQLHAAYILTPAKLMLRQQPGAAGAGVPAAQVNATAWMRAARIVGLSESCRVPGPGGHPLHRLRHLGAWEWVTHGSFLSASRDMPGCPFRVVLNHLQVSAAANKKPGAAVPANQPTAGAPVLRAIADVALADFCELYAAAGYWFSLDSGDRADAYRRVAVFNNQVGLHSGFGITVRPAVKNGLYDLLGFPLLHALLAPRPPAEDVLRSLDLLSDALGLHGGIATVSDVKRIEDFITGPPSRVVAVDADATVTTALGRVRLLVDAYAQEQRAERAAERGGGRAAAGGADALLGVGSAEASRLLAERFNGAAFQAMADSLRAELAQAEPDAVAISRRLVGSDIVLCKKFGVGLPADKHALPPNRNVFRDCETHVAKWIEVLSLTLLDLDGTGVVPAHAAGWRIDEARGDRIRRRRLAGFDIEALAFEVRGQVERTGYSAVPASQRYLNVERLDLTVLPLARRICVFLGDDPAAANSLSTVFFTLKKYLGSITKVPNDAREPYEKAAQDFVDSALVSYESTYSPIGKSTDPLVVVPVISVPRGAPCWALLTEQEAAGEVTDALRRAAPRMFEKAGYSAASVTAPPGVFAPVGGGAGSSGAGSSGAKRGRSPSPAGGGQIGSRAGELRWGANNSFGYPGGTRLI
jgi:hypothetical protein